MLTFSVDKPLERQVFLGVPEHRLETLRTAPIEVRLDDKLVMIAHASDTGLRAYRDAHATKIISELIVLDDNHCAERGLQHHLLAAQDGKRCSAFVLCGTTELAMLTHLRRMGFVPANAQVQSTVTSYPLAMLERVKLVGAALTAFVLAAFVHAEKPEMSGWFILAGMLIAGFTVLRWRDRVDISATHIRRVAWHGTRDVAFTDITDVSGYQDSLGFYELTLGVRDGSTLKLRRCYDAWGDLVRHVAR